LKLRASILLVAAAWAADATAAERPQLESPLPGAILSSGGSLRVSWSGSPGIATEWEAFLSLDGGRSFPLRVTPHLPVAEKSFEWSLPLLAASDARIRLRFGNGRREVEFDLPERFSIRPCVESRPLVPAARDLGARPIAREADNVAWADPSGDGRSFRTVAPPEPEGVVPSAAWETRTDVPDFFRSDAPDTPVPGAAGRISPVRTGIPASFPEGREAVSPLARTSRLNV